MIKRLMTFVLAFALALPAFAQLTSQQIATLKAACLADVAVCKPLHDAADDVGLAAYFNTDTVTWIVWKTSVMKDEITQDDSFDWTRVDNLTVGKARTWSELFDNASRSINPSKANVRAGIAATWVGTAADLAVQAAVLARCKRSATRAEKVLSTGTGTTATPAFVTFQGSISPAEASLIRS